MLKTFRTLQTLFRKPKIVLPAGDKASHLARKLAWANRRMRDFDLQSQYGSSLLKRYHARRMLKAYYAIALDIQGKLDDIPTT